MKQLLTVTAMILMGWTDGGLVLAQSNPFVGTWKLSSAQSTFDPGPAPKSQTRTWAADGSVKVEGLSPAGTPVAYGYPVKTDGKAYPTTGAVPLSADTIASKRVDANTIEAAFSKGGTLTDTTRFMVSRDGTTLTITATGTLPDGKALNDHLVYQKQ